MKRNFAAAFLAVAGAGVVAAAVSASVQAHSATFRSTVKSAISLDAANETITLPLHKGVTASGQTTWYVIIDSSSKTDAAARGVNYAPRLANVLATKAVQHVTEKAGVTKFAGTVNFAHKRVVVPSATGFPPTKAAPGAVGDKNYSPLITADGRVVLDAPQVANATGKSGSVTNLDVAHRRVTLKLLRGWFNGAPVLYVRTDGSGSLVTALEASTLAPNLNTAPGLGSDAASSARSAIIPVVNGARSGENRQGLQSAVLSGKDPLNITQSFPGAADYTPVWDLNPAVWTPKAISEGKRVELTSAAQVARLFKAGLLTSAGTGPANSSLDGLKALGMISICSTVAVA
ncbi:MAG TPA: hypothetical protein VGH52_08235 [Gaiellaceae bacterium]